MERLTYKNYMEKYEVNFEKSSDKNWSIAESDTRIKATGEPIEKLGELEDILESWHIENLEELKIRLNDCQVYHLQNNSNETLIHNLKNELAEFKQKAIVPKFRTYQPIFYITQFYTSTKGNPGYDIISDKYYVAENENEIILGWNYAKDFNQRKYYYVRKDWVFATKEEAEQKLAEIKGEKDEFYR